MVTLSRAMIRDRVGEKSRAPRIEPCHRPVSADTRAVREVGGKARSLGSGILKEKAFEGGDGDACALCCGSKKQV